MVEEQEETIEEWYFDKKTRQEISLEKYLCEDHVLRNRDSSCLHEVYVPSNSNEDKIHTKSRGDIGKKDL